MTESSGTSIESALHELLRCGSVSDQLTVISRHPVLTTPSATKTILVLISRTQIAERREKLHYILGLIEAAAAAGAEPPGTAAAAISSDIVVVYEHALQALAKRAAILAQPNPGLAWAGCIVGAARMLNGMRSFGHGLMSPRVVGIAHALLYDLRIAADVFAQAGAAVDRAHADHELAGLLFELAGEDHTANRQEAIVRAVAALRAFRKTGDCELTARSHRLVGAIYREAPGDLVRNQERSIFHYACALKYFEKDGDPEGCAEALYGSCAVWSERVAGDAHQNFLTAAQCIRAARAIWARRRKPLAVARADYLWATCLRQRPFDRQDGVEETIRLLNALLARLQRRPEHPTIRSLAANALSVLAQALRERARGRRPDNLKKAATALGSAVLLTDSPANPRAWARLRVHEAIVAIDLREIVPNALCYARLAIDDAIGEPSYMGLAPSALTARYWDGVIAAYEDDWVRSAAAMETVAAGQDVLFAAQRNTDGLVRNIELISGLASLGTYSVWRANGAEAAFRFLSKVRQPLAARLRKRPAKPSKSQVAVDRDEIAVAPIVTPVGGVLLIERRFKDGAAACFDAEPLTEVTAEKLQTILTPWIAACHAAADGLPESRYEAAFDKMCRDLGPLLGRPLAGCLERLGAEKDSVIAITPVGASALIPFHALPIGGGDILWSRYTVIYRPWPAGNFARPVRPKGSAPPKALVVADPDGSLGQAAGYEGVAVEFELRRAGLQTKIIGSDGDPATAAAFFRESAGARYIHVAAHGYFDWRDPRGSGIVMRNGVVTARAVSNHGKFAGCRLCMLSACETGLSDPGVRADAFVGLAAGFLEAGVESVVATLWPIPNDHVTDRLIAPFYKELLRGGLSAAEAFAACGTRDATRRTQHSVA